MALADAQKTAERISIVAQQADAALAASLTILRALVRKEALTIEEATEIANETLGVASPDQRQKIAAFIKLFLPDYQVPQFPAMLRGFSY